MFSTDVRAGAAAVAPMLLGVIPFGLVAGAAPTTAGLGGDAAVGFSTLVFAGASQLAAIELLAADRSAVVAVLAACTINLRMLLYSASLAPYVSNEPMWRRLTAAYVLTDQAYAVSITRWSSGGEGAEPHGRLPFLFGAGFLLWGAWQVCTVVGVLIGAAVPDEVPLDFAVPLVFLVLLVPSLTSGPAVVAALVGGTAAVATAEAGADELAIIVGAVAGIVGGTVAELWQERHPR